MAHDPSDLAQLAARAVLIMADGSPTDFEDVFHPEALNRESAAEPPECRAPGPAGFHASAIWLRRTYADLRWKIHEATASQDIAAVHTTMSGRQIDTFVVYDAQGVPEQAFPATGRSFAVTQTHWFRIADGTVREHWANRDDLGLAQQLGWVPPTPVYLIRMWRATRAARWAPVPSAVTG
ncbi:ester cyclase [Nocardia zapadnayensis]|uniref:ester cyclase n=1 Tax=Nocardia rhamnosiphila TaxID=426716 RepID=UPI002247CCFA|nr:ester cyclase [Nocardia zapadnayensis]MCX0275027.1 ester cyclase [Nocardia zapadnayensis]